MSVAHGAHVTPIEEHGEGGRTMEWWGMIFFICSEALIFANLIAAYLYLEVRGFQYPNGSGIWVLPSGENLPWVIPAINTVILLSSSATAVFAGKAMAQGNRRNAIIGLILTIVLGLIFLGGQINEYISLYQEHFTLQYKAFGSAFFTLTGFHGFHVTLGVIFLTICLIRTIRGDFTAHKHFAFQAGEMYWHFVDFVWVAVFSTVYLLPFLLHG
ncbi:MAG: heme-copper oxidase subunit III [Chloroflexi bacterium]|nr:MAG: heme-copper oxidase subunit III [Chloroflexota bacterium]